MTTGVPRLVTWPRDTHDVRAVVRFAKNHRMRIVPRGRAHSVEGQSVDEFSICLLTKELQLPSGRRIELDTANRRVTVAAGVTWLEIVKATSQCKLMPFVLTSALTTTVGGTLSTGGAFFGSHRFGMQIDHVYSMTVVDGTGALIECAPSYSESTAGNSRICDAVMGGLGHFGVLTAATIDLRPCTDNIHEYVLAYPSFAALADATRNAGNDGEFESVIGRVSRDDNTKSLRFICVVTLGSNDPRVPTQLPRNVVALGGYAVSRSVEPYLEYVSKSSVKYEADMNEGKYPSRLALWFEVGFPSVERSLIFSSASQVLDTLEAGESVLLVPQKPNDVPNTESLHVGSSRLGFGVLQSRANCSDALLLRETHRKWLPIAFSLGGKNYNVDSLPYTTDLWRSHLGARFQRVRTNKRKFDPYSVFPRFPELYD
ncbi:FAD-binding oxidoreductase [Novipirellula sp. SH528]|uniref:FAD-binding oxidoreductase n=1 Tax=Novipirellula sp. SH528 TaxID=3454466 RepID=UPI003FA18E20